MEKLIYHNRERSLFPNIIERDYSDGQRDTFYGKLSDIEREDNNFVKIESDLLQTAYNSMAVGVALRALLRDLEKIINWILIFN